MPSSGSTSSRPSSCPGAAGQQRRQPVICLRPRRVAGSRDPTRQRCRPPGGRSVRRAASRRPAAAAPRGASCSSARASRNSSSCLRWPAAHKRQPSRASTRARCSRRVRPCQPPYAASNAGRRHPAQWPTRQRAGRVPRPGNRPGRRGSSPATAASTAGRQRRDGLLAVEARQPRQVVAGEREVGDRVLDGDLVRPAAQPGKLGIGQVADRHLTSERPAVRAVIARTLATVGGGRQGRRGTARSSFGKLLWPVTGAGLLEWLR